VGDQIAHRVRDTFRVDRLDDVSVEPGRQRIIAFLGGGVDRQGDRPQPPTALVSQGADRANQRIAMVDMNGRARA
jgi:hypothetical protein